MKSKALQDMVVVVTGGAGRIGSCFVQEIAKNGGIPIAADINLDAMELLKLDCLPQIETVYLDITTEDSIAALISDLIARYGRIDAVVNNAYPRNKNYGRKLEDVTYVDFCENVNMHLCGYFQVAQQFCKTFKVQGFGNVINMSSIYGSMSPRFEVYQGTSLTMPVEYAAIKAAIEQLTRYFAQYFKGSGIRVNSMSPGGILDQQPADFLNAYNKHCASKGMLEVDDLLGALIFLLSDSSSCITGQNFIIDDGYSL